MTFQIKPNENETIRFPLPLIKKIDNVIKNKDVTFPASSSRHANTLLIIWCQQTLQKAHNQKDTTINGMIKPPEGEDLSGGHIFSDIWMCPINKPARKILPAA